MEVDINELSTEILWKLHHFTKSILQNIRKKPGQKPADMPGSNSQLGAPPASADNLKQTNGSSGQGGVGTPSSSSSSGESPPGIGILSNFRACGIKQQKIALLVQVSSHLVRNAQIRAADLALWEIVRASFSAVGNCTADTVTASQLLKSCSHLLSRTRGYSNDSCGRTASDSLAQITECLLFPTNG
jgi:hypothetical protein